MFVALSAAGKNPNEAKIGQQKQCGIGHPQISQGMRTHSAILILLPFHKNAPTVSVKVCVCSFGTYTHTKKVQSARSY